jgi:type III secretion protein V
VTDILRRLVQEDIPIRNMPAILEALVEWAPREKDTAVLAEYARVGLSRHISWHYGGTDKKLKAWLLEDELEDTIRKSIRQTPSGPFLALPPPVRDAVDGSLARLSNTAGERDGTVVLCQLDIRRFVRQLTVRPCPALAVLSFQELAPDIMVETVGKIGS